MWKSQYSSNIYVAKWQSLSIDHEAGPPAQRADPRLHTTENHIKHEVAEAEYVVLEGSHDDDSVGRKPVIGCARAYPHDGHKSIAPKSPLFKSNPLNRQLGPMAGPSLLTGRRRVTVLGLLLLASIFLVLMCWLLSTHRPDQYRAVRHSPVMSINRPAAAATLQSASKTPQSTHLAANTDIGYFETYLGATQAKEAPSSRVYLSSPEAKEDMALFVRAHCCRGAKPAEGRCMVVQTCAESVVVVMSDSRDLSSWDDDETHTMTSVRQP